MNNSTDYPFSYNGGNTSLDQDFFYKHPSDHQQQQAQDIDIDDFLVKEKELSDLAELRLKTLENIVAEKAKIIGEQQQELDQLGDQNKRLHTHMAESGEVIQDYQNKFEKVREIMHQKEITISDLKANVQNLEDVMAQKQNACVNYENKSLIMQDQIRDLKAQIAEKLGDQQQAFEDERQRETSLLKQALAEKEKRLEIIQFEHEENMNIALESKDKQIRQIQEQMTEAYYTQQQEIYEQAATIQQTQTDLELKQSYLESLKGENKQKEEMLQQHIDKLKDMLEQKTQMTDELDCSNRALVQQIGDLKRTVNELDNRSNVIAQEQRFEVENAERDWSGKLQKVTLEASLAENSYKQQIKNLEREKDRMVLNLQNMQVEIKNKESGVKSDLERIWADWEQKQEIMEADLEQANNLVQQMELQKKISSKEIIELKKENRTLQTQVKEKQSEIMSLQENYEDMLNKLKSEKEEIISSSKRIEDGLQYEVEFFKKEIARISKKDELMKQQQEHFKSNTPQDNDNFFSVQGRHQYAQEEKEMSFNRVMSGLQTPEQRKKSTGGMNFDAYGTISEEKNDQINKMDDIVAKAQASISKVINSPFVPKHNDSLDAMRLDFMQDYNNIMKTSDENFFNGNSNKKQTKTESKPEGALSQMVAAGNLIRQQGSEEMKNLQVENEQLKAMIQIMKVEREGMLKQSFKAGPSGPHIKEDMDTEAQLILQKEIITKERRIFDLERNLNMSRSEVQRLKNERDRLVHISNELRAELNQAKSKANHFRSMVDSGQNSGRIAVIPEEDSMESTPSARRQDRSRSRSRSPGKKQNMNEIQNPIFNQQQQQLSNLSHVVGELAEQMRGWINASTKEEAAAPKLHNYNRGARGNDILAKDNNNNNRSKSRGRVFRGHSKDVTPITKSPSPESKMRSRGLEFMSRIDELKKDLEVQGDALQLLQQDMQPEGIAPKAQKTKETESQKRALSGIRRSIEQRKRAEEQKKAEPIPVSQRPEKAGLNYNALRKNELVERFVE